MEMRILEEDPCSVVGTTDFDEGLHVASIFIVFAVSALGVAIPVMARQSKSLSVHPYWITLGKCAGIGVMLACALVHMLLPSTESLTSECVPEIFHTTYPAFSYFFALVAAMSVHLGEFVLASFLEGTIDPVQPREDNTKGKSLDDCDSVGEEEDPTSNVETEAQTQTEKVLLAKRFAEVLMVEFSLSLHSVLIGITVGITDREALVALLVALVFHQTLEGVALGSRLSDSALSLRTVGLFAAIFALSAPLGIIIGMSTYRTFKESGQTFLLVQGVFEGICGGILLYTGFLLLIEDFPKDMARTCHGERQRLMKAGMFGVLWMSAFGMSLIGVWL